MSSDTSPSKSKGGFRQFIRHHLDATKDALKSMRMAEQARDVITSDAGSSAAVAALGLETGPKLTQNSNIHLSIPGCVPTQRASASAPDLALGASPLSPSPVVSDSIVPSDARKKHWGPSWTELESTLRVLHGTARVFPLLESTIGTLISCLEVIQTAAKRHRDYDDLASNLRDLTVVLETHLRTSGLTDVMSDCTSNILKSLQKEVESINRQKERLGGLVMGVVRANEDAEELIRNYRRIESHFRLLQVDVTLSTWAITKEQLANIRLEAMSPAKSATYNSAVPTNVVRSGCIENTRTSVLSTMNDWSDNPDAAKVYWLNGMAGTGKTTIACSLSAALANRKQLGASFFCARVLEDCRDVIRIVPTIAYQLARYSLPFQCALCKILLNDPDIAKRNISVQFKRLLKDPLQEAGDAMPGNVVVVIDGLDECDDDELVREFLDTLFQNAPDLPLKFFVAGRPEPKIREEMLSRGEAARSVLHLHEIDRASVQADIEIYLRKELAASVPLSEDELAQLVKLSDNLFIYAATTVRYIRPKKQSVNARERLLSVLSVKSNPNKAYAELDALYQVILRGALDEDGLENIEAKRARHVLWTVVCAREPVRVRTLAALTGLSEENTSTVLQSLGSVLHTSTENELVSPLHASFPDFIFNSERSHKFFCDRESHSPLLAQQCFEVMRAQLRFNICGLESSFALDETVKDLEGRVKNSISEELLYSCRYWGDHLSLATVTTAMAETLCDSLEDFLSNRLLFWMEVLNLSKFRMLGVFMLQKVQSWLARLNCGAPADLTKLASDAHDFVTLFSSNPISLATPHIYTSLLAFCHKSSSIFARYQGRMRGLMNVKGTVMDHRGSPALATWDIGESVISVAVSPDGSLISYGARTREGHGVFGILNQHTGASVVCPFRGHAGIVISAAFSPDCTRIVFGLSDNTLCVWNTRDGGLDAGPFKGHTGWVTSVAFSPEGSRIASGSNDCTICVWDVRNGKLIAGPSKGHASSVRSVAFSHDGTLIASGSNDNTIRVWNPQDGKSVGSPLVGHTSPVRSVAFSISSNITLIVSGSEDKTVCVWSTDGRLVAGPLKGHTDSVRSVAFSPSGTRIVSASNDGNVCVWDVQSEELTAGPFTGHTYHVNSVTFSPDGARIVSGSEDNTIFMWNGQDHKVVPNPLKGHVTFINSIAFCPDGSKIVSGSDDSTICVWDAQDGGLVAGPFEGHTDCISSVAFSSDGARIASGSKDRKIYLWSVQDRKLIAGPFEGHDDHISSVAFSSDGTRIVSGSNDSIIYVWDVRYAKPVAGPLEGHSNGVRSVVFSSDGTRIVSGYGNGSISIWNAEDGKLVNGPLKHEGPSSSVSSVAFSLDCTRIVSGSNDGTIFVWDAPSRKLVAGPFKGHTGYVSSVAFSHDGLNVVSASGDKTIRIWDLASGRLVADPLKGHTDYCTLVLFSPDGRHVISSSSDGAVRCTNLQSIATTASGLAGEWEIKPSGWVTNQEGCHLFWVPLHLRQFLPRLYHQFVIGPEGPLCINFSNTFLGESWRQCYFG